MGYLAKAKKRAGKMEAKERKVGEYLNHPLKHHGGQKPLLGETEVRLLLLNSEEPYLAGHPQVI
jgi:hypothetical protein